MVLIIIAVLVVLIVVTVLVLIWMQPKQIESFQSYETPVMDSQATQCLLFKTHQWNDEIDAWYRRLVTECPYTVYLMYHNDNLDLSAIPTDLHGAVMVYSEEMIRTVYPEAPFYGMWLSNHWILSWAMKTLSYDYVWNIEYDVRIVGDSRWIWTYRGGEDFIYPIATFQNPDWPYREMYRGPLTHAEKWYGYLQLARYSRRFLQYLDAIYPVENGQDELITYSLFHRSGMTGSHHLLGPWIKSSWFVDNVHIPANRERIRAAEAKGDRLLVHPVK